MPAGFFDRKVTIHSHVQMMDRLKQRMEGNGTLTWNNPVRNADDTGHQTACGAPYEIRKTLTAGKICYWAWYERKLLGYSGDITIAKAHCEAHALGAGT